MTDRLKRILKENAEFERKSPYNFCDRWCERCRHEKQSHCRLYQDEFEQKITCIAHGKDPDDPEMTAQIMEKQFEGIAEGIQEKAEEFGIDLDALDDEMGREEETDRQNIRKKVDADPLYQTAKNYSRKTHSFLRDTLYKNQGVDTSLTYDFQTVAWYHSMLQVKLHRALSGFYEPVDEDDFGMHDAIAQFQVCKKAIAQSIEALRKIKPVYPVYQTLLTELLALLGNIESRILAMEESI